MILLQSWWKTLLFSQSELSQKNKSRCADTERDSQWSWGGDFLTTSLHPTPDQNLRPTGDGVWAEAWSKALWSTIFYSNVLFNGHIIVGFCLGHLSVFSSLVFWCCCLVLCWLCYFPLWWTCRACWFFLSLHSPCPFQTWNFTWHLPIQAKVMFPSGNAVRCSMWVTGRRDTCIFKVSPCPVPTGWNGDWALGRVEPSGRRGLCPSIFKRTATTAMWSITEDRNSPLSHWSQC